MSAYHLSPLRNKGWFRAGAAMAVAMFPITGLYYGLGYFGEGWDGMKQAGEFVGAGFVLALVVALTGGWVMRGFAVRVRETEEERDDVRPSSSPSSAGPSHAGGGRPAAGRASH